MDQLLLLLPLLLLVLIFTSGRRRQKAAAETQRQLSPGSSVITTAGLHASVVEVDDTTVLLEVAPGVRTRWARGAVARVVEPPVTTVGDDTIAGPITGPIAGRITGTAQRLDQPSAQTPVDRLTGSDRTDPDLQEPGAPRR